MLVYATGILRRHDLAEEAVQDAFVRIWDAASGFDITKDRLGTGWIYAILRNRCLTILRSRAREETRDDGFFNEQRDERPSAEAAAIRESEMRRLDHCIGELKPLYRESLLLVYAVGLKQEDVAAVMGVPLGTVKSRLRRAILQVKGQLE